MFSRKNLFTSLERKGQFLVGKQTRLKRQEGQYGQNLCANPALPVFFRRVFSHQESALNTVTTLILYQQVFLAVPREYLQLLVRWQNIQISSIKSDTISYPIVKGKKLGPKSFILNNQASLFTIKNHEPSPYLDRNCLKREGPNIPM